MAREVPGTRRETQIADTVEAESEEHATEAVDVSPLRFATDGPIPAVNPAPPPPAVASASDQAFGHHAPAHHGHGHAAHAHHGPAHPHGHAKPKKRKLRRHARGRGRRARGHAHPAVHAHPTTRVHAEPHVHQHPELEHVPGQDAAHGDAASQDPVWSHLNTVSHDEPAVTHAEPTHTEPTSTGVATTETHAATTPTTTATTAETHAATAAPTTTTAETHAATTAPPTTTTHVEPSHAHGAHEAPAAHTGTAATTPAADASLLAAPVSRVVLGVTIYAGAGTHAAAVARVAEIIQIEIGRNQFAQKKLADSRATIVIIPAHTPMTDMPQFHDLRGKTTFDGRDWATVRGSGGIRAADGSFAIGVAEENLVVVAQALSSYPKGYSVTMHEFAHAVNSHGMTREQQSRVNALYARHAHADRGNAHDTFTDRYAASNSEEYFAQATNAFFNRNAMGRNHNGRDWLQANDPELYAFLVEFYESSYNADGERQPAPFSDARAV